MNSRELLQRYQLSYEKALEIGVTHHCAYYRQQIMHILNKICSDAGNIVLMRMRVNFNREKIKHHSVMLGLGFKLKNGFYVYP